MQHYCQSTHERHTIVELANVAWRAHSPEVMPSFVLHDLMLLDTTLLMLLHGFDPPLCSSPDCAAKGEVGRCENVGVSA